jgi:hypothetical protein
LPANRLDLSFPYRSLLDFGLVADAGAVAWFGFSTDGETGSAGTRPDLPSGLPTGVNLFPILPSFSSQSNLYTPVLDTLRATQPSSFTEERYYNPRLQAISRTTKRQPRGPCPEESSPVYSPRDLWRLTSVVCGVHLVQGTYYSP